jgi:hypothetical protein
MKGQPMTHATLTAAGTVFPELRRLRYFNGQLLTAGDFRREQGYFIEKLRLRNRCLHGYGIACGLTVTAVPPDDPCFKSGRPRVRIEPGVAVDCLGNEIVVAYPCVIDLWEELPAADREEIQSATEASVYISIVYCERPVGPTRGVFLDDCGNSTGCEYGWCRDGWRAVVGLVPPKNGGCADPCCGCCPDERLLLACIDHVKANECVEPDMIHLDHRRPLTRYRYTTITGVNWTHGGTYTREQVAHLLATRETHHGSGSGLRVQFSAPVHAKSLQQGVVEIRVIEGGRGRNATSWYVAGRFTDLPDDGLVTGFRYEQTTEETVQHGDQIGITIRTPFILDHCCRPVDGAHVGGRVPLLHGYEPGRDRPPHDFCREPPGGGGRWTTGTGTGAGVFESWLYVER